MSYFFEQFKNTPYESMTAFFKGDFSTHFPPNPIRMVKAHPDKYIEQPEKSGFQKAEISPQQPEPLNFLGYRECAHVETVALLSKEKIDL